MAAPSTDILSEIAGLLADQKLVPFIGAGLSRNHLGFDAAELARQFAGELAAPLSTPLSIVSDEYAARKGADAFLAALRARLIVTVLDESKVEAHIQVLSLNASHIYTTNQDNIFELVSEKYGRSYKTIVTLDDMSNASPREKHFYKFHGDLGHPDTMVFGAASYEKRILNQQNPLDVRLQSDLLGRQLLFLGYSFRDENVQKLFRMISGIFNGKMPRSYLIAFDSDPALEALTKEYPITIVYPNTYFPTAGSNSEAFSRLLDEICERTISLQASLGVDELFSSRIVNSRVVTRHELRAVGETIRYGSFSDALAAFRGKFDAALVPSYLTKDASELFAQLAAKAHSGNERDLEELKGALFNLRLPPAEAVQAVADFMSRTNSRKPVSGFDHFISIACPALPDGCVSVAASVAAASLLDRGERLSSDFLKLFFYWSSDRDRLPDPLREKVESVIRITWNGRNDYPSPLAAPASPFRTKGFHEIHEDLLRNFPKTLKSSSEE